jgi:hypothetical protein
MSSGRRAAGSRRSRPVLPKVLPPDVDRVALERLWHTLPPRARRVLVSFIRARARRSQISLRPGPQDERSLKLRGKVRTPLAMNLRLVDPRLQRMLDEALHRTPRSTVRERALDASVFQAPILLLAYERSDQGPVTVLRRANASPHDVILLRRGVERSSIYLDIALSRLLQERTQFGMTPPWSKEIVFVRARASARRSTSWRRRLREWLEDLARAPIRRRRGLGHGRGITVRVSDGNAGSPRELKH